MKFKGNIKWFAEFRVVLQITRESSFVLAYTWCCILGGYVDWLKTLFGILWSVGKWKLRLWHVCFAFTPEANVWHTYTAAVWSLINRILSTFTRRSLNRGQTQAARSGRKGRGEMEWVRARIYRRSSAINSFGVKDDAGGRTRGNAKSTCLPWLPRRRTKGIIINTTGCRESIYNIYVIQVSKRLFSDAQQVGACTCARTWTSKKLIAHGRVIKQLAFPVGYMNIIMSRNVLYRGTKRRNRSDYFSRFVVAVKMTTLIALGTYKIGTLD